MTDQYFGAVRGEMASCRERNHLRAGDMAEVIVFYKNLLENVNEANKYVLPGTPPATLPIILGFAF
ncbi:hypothetical protein MJ575_13400 [Klebsiella pneumoniae]|nr:hypothetical protein MJ575_13400 [Klebsiella pneumoniae]